MVKNDRPTVFARFGGFFFFLVLTLACLCWFVWSAYNIFGSISAKAPVVHFDKGSLYMLGAGIGLAALTFAVLYEGILGRELNKKITKVITRGALFGILFMFALPNVWHYLVDTHLSKEKYVLCSGVSYQWFLYKNIAYTDNKNTCEMLVEEKELTKSSSGR